MEHKTEVIGTCPKCGANTIYIYGAGKVWCEEECGWVVELGQD